jgi:RNA polymerase sigma-70 factor (ECF subfamily)
MTIDKPSANAEAFALRLAAMRPRLHRYCARMTGSVIDGEDVVQDAMIKALEAFSRAGEIANVEAWVFRIAHNCALDLLRHRARQQAWITEEAVEEMADPSVDTEHRLAAAASLKTFMQLPPAQRGCVILMDVLGYSLREIGDVLDASTASVKANLHRGRAQLRELADDDAPPPVRPLSELERRQLSGYVDRFNARDFDALRAMLAQDVRLDLVGRTQDNGKAVVGNYYSRYEGHFDWRMAPGQVEGRPAVLVYDVAGELAYFILLDWTADGLSVIRDFRYARYALEGAAIKADS